MHINKYNGMGRVECNQVRIFEVNNKYSTFVSKKKNTTSCSNKYCDGRYSEQERSLFYSQFEYCSVINPINRGDTFIIRLLKSYEVYPTFQEPKGHSFSRKKCWRRSN